MICDRQTDGQTDGCPEKNNMSPDPEGGRHNDKISKALILPQKCLYTLMSSK